VELHALQDDESIVVMQIERGLHALPCIYSLAITLMRTKKISIQAEAQGNPIIFVYNGLIR
jgi:hypothetical protein